MSLSPPVAIAQEIFRRDKAFRREREPGRGLMDDNVFSKYLLCSLSSRSFVSSRNCSADFLESGLDEQFAAHTDAAMKEGIRNLNAFVAQRESPGQRHARSCYRAECRRDQRGWRDCLAEVCVSMSLVVSLSRGGWSSHKPVSFSAFARFSFRPQCGVAPPPGLSRLEFYISRPAGRDSSQKILPAPSRTSCRAL